MRRLFLLILALVPSASAAQAQGSFVVQRLADGVYAALARPGGQASSNAFFVEMGDYTVAGGAHLTKEAIADLQAAAVSATGRPVRYFVLTHHHHGFSYLDFDFPPAAQVLTSGQTWQSLNDEVRQATFPVFFFSEGLTLKAGERVLVLMNLGQGHTEGDVVVYLPEEEILFASDLVYIGSVGYMGEGHMQSWAVNLEFLESLDVRRIVPGIGPVAAKKDLTAFKTFFKAFLSEVLRHLEQGDSLKKTKKTFALPKYRHLTGYDQFLEVNLERAYRDLQENVLRR